MGAVKAMLMDEEEKVWDLVADVISESEDISEAQSKAFDLFDSHQLLGYVDEDMIEEGVSEMWNEYWSQYA
tara:strand:- start:269 stop:481 length:213 start_codon:yes stop_codon:yes gene_type:complete